MSLLAFQRLKTQSDAVIRTHNEDNRIKRADFSKSLGLTIDEIPSWIKYEQRFLKTDLRNRQALKVREVVHYSTHCSKNPSTRIPKKSNLVSTTAIVAIVYGMVQTTPE